MPDSQQNVLLAVRVTMNTRHSFLLRQANTYRDLPNDANNSVTRQRGRVV